HQFMVCRVVLDRVDAVTEAIVGPQLGCVAIGLSREHLHALAADQLPQFACGRGYPSSAFPRHRFLQGAINRPGVQPDERGGLIARFCVGFHAGAGHASYCNEVGWKRDKIARHGRKKANDMDGSAKEVATLAGGCFWCLEAVFDGLRGVESVESGYMGGTTVNPTYEQVCSGDTG